MFDNRYSNLISGINDSKMKEAIFNCYKISEELSKKFLEVENTMYNLKDYYKCDGAQELFIKFDDFKANFATVVENVHTYGDDLTSVRENFHKMTDNATQILRYNERDE